MIILISGASHTGKTLISQKLLNEFHIPYLSLDHLKMGLIRSKQTDLTVYDDESLTEYLWSITREIIKTVIENKQNLIIEGCYIPFDWKKSFSDDYLREIKYICLVMSAEYIRNNFSTIINNSKIAENRICDDFTLKEALEDNYYYLQECRHFNCPYYEIKSDYNVEVIFDGIVEMLNLCQKQSN